MWITKVFFIGFIVASSVVGDKTVINTNYGKIQGFIDVSSKGRDFYTFHNIPFAKAPLGKLRFKDPQEPDPWSGVRNGTQKHASCPHPFIIFYMKDQRKLFVGEEDCLHLSVYTPKIEGDLLPVMMYLHGGAFVGGSGTFYSGHDLVDEDVLLVSINYRLGVLGFLSSEDDIMPGNLGLKDQTMALRWIQANIHNFGGDPSRVTIFGNSAGGASVHFHILSPSSRGLFKRAILQSGTALCPWTHSKGLRAIAHQVGSAVGCFTPSDIGKQQSQRLLDCLQQIDKETLVMTFDSFMNWTFLPVNFNAFMDGYFLPDEPEILLKEGKYQDVDIIIGVNRDEGAFVTNSLFDENDFLEKLRRDIEYYGPVSLGISYDENSEGLSRKVYDYYLNKQTISVDDADKLNQMYGDRHFKLCTDIVAKMHSRNDSNKVYMYELEYRGEISFGDIYDPELSKYWIAHADDLFYLFPNEKFRGGLKRNQNDAKMTEIMTRLWANFARNGIPTPDDSMEFRWDPFTIQSQQHLSLDLKPRMKANIREKVGEFWSSLPLKENKLLSIMDRKKVEL